jgi:hypothetical protein
MYSSFTIRYFKDAIETRRIETALIPGPKLESLSSKQIRFVSTVEDFFIPIVDQPLKYQKQISIEDLTSINLKCHNCSCHIITYDFLFKNA